MEIEYQRIKLEVAKEIARMFQRNKNSLTDDESRGGPMLA